MPPQQPAQLVIDDEAAFIQWASEHEPDLLRAKVEIDRTSDRWKTLTTTDDGTLVDPVLGHKIEHVRQVRPEDKYSVKTPRVRWCRRSKHEPVPTAKASRQQLKAHRDHGTIGRRKTYTAIEFCPDPSG